jgi:uncharacterized protein
MGLFRSMIGQKYHSQKLTDGQPDVINGQVPSHFTQYISHLLYAGLCLSVFDIRLSVQRRNVLIALSYTLTTKNKIMKTKTRRLLKYIAAFCTVMLLYTVSSCKKEVFNQGTVKSFSLQSAVNGVTYDIKVALPSGYNPSAGKYATIYLLDGEEIFDFTANSCHDIAGKYGVTNALVVSIGYGQDRSIDYTPTKISNSTGGAPSFLDFMTSQLIPSMEQDYNVDTSRAGRVILGHSYGGLFGAYAFCVSHQVFGHYLLLSPSLWFDNLVTLRLEKENRDLNKHSSALVFMGIGEAENSGRMQAPFESFYQTIRDRYPAVKLAKNREKNLAHLGSRNPNIIKSLDFYFQNR